MLQKISAQIFVKNRLVVIYPKDNPAGLKELKDLAKPGLKLILAAKEVPVGQYSLDFLDKASKDPAFGPSFKEEVLKNVVSIEENVKAVYTKSSPGRGGRRDCMDKRYQPTDGAGQIGSLDIPDALNVIAVYPIAAMRDSRTPGSGQSLYRPGVVTGRAASLAEVSFHPCLPE